MPEVNTDKIFAAFLLRLEEVAQIEDFDDIEKEFLGKNSLLSEERKSLSTLNEVSRKKSVSYTHLTLPTTPYV